MNSQQKEDVFGELALADTTLCILLQEFLQALPGGRPNPKLTTGQAAKALRQRASKINVIPAGFDDWIDRVKEAADRRNRILHAAARERCLTCGHATRFEHLGERVDRSLKTVHELTDEIDGLTRQGLGFARDISYTLNKTEEAAARTKAAETGKPQAPSRVQIGQRTSYECPECNEKTGRDTLRVGTTVRVGQAVAVYPPGTPTDKM